MMYVSARHTVMAGTPQRQHGPGEMVTLAADEDARLAALGFLPDAPPVLPAANAVPGLNPAGIGPHGGEAAQGPRYEPPQSTQLRRSEPADQGRVSDEAATAPPLVGPAASRPSPPLPGPPAFPQSGYKLSACSDNH